MIDEGLILRSIYSINSVAVVAVVTEAPLIQYFYRMSESASMFSYCGQTMSELALVFTHYVYRVTELALVFLHNGSMMSKPVLVLLRCSYRC
jgi:hypothetical protein